MKYQEVHEAALKSLDKAILLDPLWEAPRNKRDELLQYLKDTQDSIQNHGKVKLKRLYQMIRVIMK